MRRNDTRHATIAEREDTDQPRTKDHTMTPDRSTFDPYWRSSAVCAQTDPRLFFPGKGGGVNPAKRVCRGCPVQAECLEFGLHERYGVWGGLSERERRRVAAARQRAASLEAVAA